MKIFQKNRDNAGFRTIKFCNVTLYRYIRKKDRTLLNSIMADPISAQDRTGTPYDAMPCFDLNFDHIYQSIEKVPATIEFKEEDAPLVSIIIPVYNNYFYTKQCLASIAKNVKDVSFEIIIADDHSTDETQNIQQFASNITLTQNKRTKGFLQNCNNAIECARGKYTVFLNNDTQVMPQWLESLVEVMERDKSVGMVGSKLVYPDGSLQEAGGIIFSDASGWNYGRNDNPSRIDYNYLKEVDYISGASIMLETELLRELDGFDARYEPAYYEDTDMAMRIRHEKGLKVVYQPKSVLIHYEGKSNGTETNSGLKQYQVINKEKFATKWVKELQSDHYATPKDLFFAKDHAKKKKKVLVIDWKILTYSKDTGSRTTYQYMHFFKQCGFDVKFYPHDHNFADIEFLQDHCYDGFEVILERFDSFIEKYGQSFDYVYLNRPNIAPHYIEKLRKHSTATIIYQCHDLHYLRQYRERLINKNRKAEERLITERQAEFDVFKKMDVLCSFSCDEIKEVHQHDSSIPAIQIPLFIYDQMPVASYQATERKDIIFVAGFSHTPNVDAALWFVQEVLPLVKSEIPDIKFYIIGSNPKPEVKALANENVIVTGFVTEEELEEHYRKAKLVVVPLRYGAGVKGKIIEALYNKVPVVTTSIGVEGIPNQSKLIDVQDDAAQHAASIIKLYQDNDALQAKSDACTAFIKDHYSTNAAINSLKGYIDFQ